MAINDIKPLTPVAPPPVVHEHEERPLPEKKKKKDEDEPEQENGEHNEAGKDETDVTDDEAGDEPDSSSTKRPPNAPPHIDEYV